MIRCYHLPHQRLTQRAAVARGDFTEAELQADRFFQPANKADSPGDSR
jgi:hypothetical protein